MKFLWIHFHLPPALFNFQYNGKLCVVQLPVISQYSIYTSYLTFTSAAIWKFNHLFDNSTVSYDDEVMGVKCEIDFDICSFWWIISKEKLAMNLFALKCIISANWLIFLWKLIWHLTKIWWRNRNKSVANQTYCNPSYIFIILCWKWS